MLRVRNKQILRALDIMQQWLADGFPPAADDGDATQD
jgi:hypothetical protein